MYVRHDNTSSSSHYSNLSIFRKTKSKIFVGQGIKRTFCRKFCTLCCLTGEKHCFLRSIGGFVFGVLLGFGFYLFILLDMDLGIQQTLWLGVLTMILLALGNATSNHIRCICLLTLPAAFGQTGRGFLKTFALAFVVSGPLANLALNSREVVRVFGCTSQLTYNLTRTKYEILSKPFQDALINMRHDEQLVMDTLEAVQDVVDPLVEEVEGQEEVERLRAESDYIDLIEGDSPRSKGIEKKYLELKEKRKRTNNSSEDDNEIYEMEYRKKVEYRCEGIINQGTNKCRELFHGVYDKCYDAVGVVVGWLLCWPMKLTFMCNLVSVFGGNSLCDSSHVVEPGFGEGYMTVKNAKGLLSQNLGDVKVKYVMRGELPKVNSKSAIEAANEAMKEFNAGKTWFDVTSIFLKRAFAFVFFLIVYRAAIYQEKYLADLDFDNKYITEYFRKLDRRQREEGHRWLLPLKKKEAKNLIDLASILPGQSAIFHIIKQSLLLVLEMLPATTFFVLDLLFYEILDVIATHAHVEFTQKGKRDNSDKQDSGEVHLTVKVHGGGLVANLVRSLVRDLNVNQSVHVIHSNVTCLPKPSLISRYFVAKVYGIYFLSWLLVIADSYSGRLNRLICSHFYPKREKRRVLYLYNETLRRRVRNHADFMARIKRHVNEAKLRLKANWLLSLRLQHPRIFGWLHWCSCARRLCLVCGNEEPAKTGVVYIECPTPHCHTVHCVQCWREVRGVCYACEEDLDEEEYSGEV